MNILRKSLLLFCMGFSCSSSLFACVDQAKLKEVNDGMRNLLFTPVLDQDFLNKDEANQANLFKHDLVLLYNDIKVEKEDINILSDLISWQKTANIKFEILFAKKSIAKKDWPSFKLFVLNKIYEQLSNDKLVDDNFINNSIKSFCVCLFYCYLSSDVKKLLDINLYDLDPEFCEEYCSFMQDYRSGLNAQANPSLLLTKSIELEKNNISAKAFVLFKEQLSRIEKCSELYKEVLNIYKKADKGKQEILTAHLAILKNKDFRNFAQDTNFSKLFGLYKKLVWTYLRSNYNNSYAYNRESNVDPLYELKLRKVIPALQDLYESIELMPSGWFGFFRQKFLYKLKSEKNAEPIRSVLLKMIIILRKVNGEDIKDDKGILSKIIDGNISEVLWKLGGKIV